MINKIKSIYEQTFAWIIYFLIKYLSPEKDREFLMMWLGFKLKLTTQQELNEWLVNALND